MTWLRPDGAEMEDGDWNDPDARTLGMRLRNDTQGMLVLFNSHYEEIAFQVPVPSASDDWACILDTDAGAIHLGTPPRIAPGEVPLSARCIMVLEDVGP